MVALAGVGGLAGSTAAAHVDVADGVDDVGAGSDAVAAVAAATPDVFFSDHFASLCRTAYLVLGDAWLAEEIVMDAFARTMSRWSKVQDADAPLAYVRRTVVNLCISRLRRLGAERRANARATSGTESPVRWDVERFDDSRAVFEAVRQLPERQRACVVLRYFDDLPEQQIAAALGCSVGTVKSQLSKARARLAQLLEVEEV